MSVEIGEVRCIEAVALANELGISRQTLWRWRRAGLIPTGHLYRGQLVFTLADADAVRAHANRLVPATVDVRRREGA